jgi:hypothetical protein
MTLEVPGNESGDTSKVELDNIQEWTTNNRMALNMKKTYEMIVRGNVPTPLPDPFPSIERKTWLKILGIILQDLPCNWDLQFEEMLQRASARLYIIRVRKYYGFPIKQLDILFRTLIMPILTYGIELWGGAYFNKYISQIDRFIKRARRNGYISEALDIKEINTEGDKKLWNKILVNTRPAV